MSADSNSSLIKSFVVVLGGLVLFTVCIMFLARLIAPAVEYDEAFFNQSIQERIAPVGKIRTAAENDDSTATAEVAAAPKSGEELYKGVCASCHDAGVADAPKLGDEAAWAKRGETGVDTLVATVVSGKGAMPANGGSSYSDEQIKSVVKYLLGSE